jgi:hypothetical protein
MAKFHVPLGRNWTPEEEALLGTATDAQIARRLRRTVGSVAWRRREKGIPPLTNVRPWTAQEIAMLGTLTDRKIARKLGRTASAVSCKRRDCKILSAGSRSRTSALR